MIHRWNVQEGMLSFAIEEVPFYGSIDLFFDLFVDLDQIYSGVRLPDGHFVRFPHGEA